MLQGKDEPRLYRTGDDRDEDWNGAVADPAVVDEAWATWRGEIDLGAVVPLGAGTVSVRDVLVHLVEEYARHVGHADLLHKCIDGRTGQ